MVQNAVFVFVIKQKSPKGETTKALLVKAVISVLDEIFCGFMVFGVFIFARFFGF